MSSCESYIQHRWVLDLSEEDMKVLRTMVARTLIWAKVVGSTKISDPDYAAFMRVHDLVECIE